MYEFAVVLHDESGNNKGNGIQRIKEASHPERIRYDVSISPHVLHVPGISCPDITSLQTASSGHSANISVLQTVSSGHSTDITALQTASSGHGTDITALQNTITTLQNSINTQALTISALNNALTTLSNRVGTLEDPMAAVHVDNN